MWKKWNIVILFLAVLLLAACNSSSDDLTGDTFKIALTPPLEEDAGNPSAYSELVTLSFSDGNVVTNKLDDVEGTYTLTGETLVLPFENDHETLDVEFTDFKKSEKKVSEYSAIISESEIEMTDTDQVSQFLRMVEELEEGMPVEFVRE